MDIVKIISMTLSKNHFLRFKFVTDKKLKINKKFHPLSWPVKIGNLEFWGEFLGMQKAAQAVSQEMFNKLEMNIFVGKMHFHCTRRWMDPGGKK